MRRPAIQLFIVLTSIVAILAAAQLFAAADGPLRIYLPSIFKQADGSSTDQPGDGDTPGGGDTTGGGDDVYVFAPTGFEIEGNLALDGDPASHIDWETTEFPPAAHIEDPHSKRGKDPTIFKPDGKFDKPESWIIQSGSVGPGQDELTNILAWFVLPNDIEDGRPSDSWLVMGMERTKKEGTFFLDFEYNQLVWDPASGGLTRSPGDVVVGFELKGNPTDREKDLSVLIVQIFEEQPSLCEVTPGNGNMPAEVRVGTDPCPAYGNGGFYYRFLADGAILADSGLGEATMNAEPLPVPAGWNSYDSQGKSRDVIPPFHFAEAAINLQELGIALDCGTFSSMHAKDRSSLEPNADLKDLAGPVETEINCKISGHKFHDLDANGEWAGDPPEEGLEGWDIHIENLDTGWTADTKTDADGFYEFDALRSGTYEVSESCPANEDWLQTRPGMTDFDGCGSETYTIDINLENREDTDNDFGNIDPALEVLKQCPAEVFVGDQILYEVTVRNVGSPILTNISVDDSLLGHLGDIATLEPEESETLTATLIAETTGPITNTASASTSFASVTVSDEATCVTDAFAPLVTKDADPSYKRRYVWEIEKDVDRDTYTLLPEQVVTATYTLTVTARPANFDNQVRGTITIDNPASIDAHFDSLTDMLSNGIEGKVTCPSDAPYTVPAGGEMTCTYETELFQDHDPEVDLVNTATANRISNIGSIVAVTGTADVVFGDPAEVIDAVARVADEGEAHRVDGPPVLPTDVHFSEATLENPWTLTYQRRFGPQNECQVKSIVNTATVTALDTGQVDQASVTVDFLLLCNVFLAYEDQPATLSDWDYNDVVINIDFVPTFLESGNLSVFTFVMTQTADLSAAKHEFFIKPDFTSGGSDAAYVGCNGSFTRTGGRIEDKDKNPQGGFINGETLIFVTSDTAAKNEMLPPVEVTISFSATAAGCEPELSDVDLLANFHCEDCFFGPELESVQPKNKWPPQHIVSGDVRMLGVPDEDWHWPAETDPHTHISVCYPRVSPASPPDFVRLWWDVWSGPSAACPLN
jgi:hypothetical protein